MTREEAIDVLKHNYPSACFTDLCEAVEIAIQALSAQPERNFLSGLTPEEQYEKLKWLFTDYGMQHTDSRQAIIQWLASHPERKGKWIGKHERGLFSHPNSITYQCSECGYSIYTVFGMPTTTNYCPNCGWQMEREQDEID